MKHNWELVWLTDELEGFRCSECKKEVLEIDEVKEEDCEVE